MYHYNSLVAHFCNLSSVIYLVPYNNNPYWMYEINSELYNEYNIFRGKVYFNQVK